MLVLLIAGVAAIVLNQRDEPAQRPSVVGLYAPDFRVKDLGTGRILTSADFRGKIVFLNFWASWCNPCKEEMPTIDALHKDTQSDKDFVMITVLYKDSAVNALAYMKSRGYTFPVYTDPGGETAENFGVTGVPETYVIGGGGILKKKTIGPDDWVSQENRNFISSLLR